MYRSLLLIVFTGLFIPVALAQSVTVDWLKNSGGESWELVNDLVIDESNNIYVAGNYSMGASLTDDIGRGNRDMFIAKYDSLGNEIWSRPINNESYCYVNQLLIIDDDNFIISGVFSGKLQLGSYELEAEGAIDVFLAFLDSYGKPLWLIQLEGNPKGKKTIIGNYKDHVFYASTFTDHFKCEDQVYQTSGADDIVLCKFNKEGKFLSSSILEGTGKDEITDMAIDPLGNIYLSGAFEKHFFAGEYKLQSNGMSDVFLLKLDQDLNVLKAWSAGSDYDDFGKSISLDNNNKIILAGSFNGVMDIGLDSLLRSVGKTDVFICQLDEGFNLIWGDCFGGLANEYLQSVGLNRLNDIYLCGQYRGEINKDDYLITSVNFSSDIFLVKYSHQGVFKYMETLGDTNSDFAKSLYVDGNNDILINGNFNHFLKVLSDTSSNVKELDYFLTKLYDCDFSTPISLPADTALCGWELLITADSSYTQYIWNNTPGGFEYTTDTSGFLVLEVNDKRGCKSVDSIFIQLNEPPFVDLGDDIIIHKGELVTLIAGVDNENTYLWSNKTEGQTLSFETKDLKAGRYTIAVKVSSKNGCISNDEVIIEVIENQDQKKFELSISAYPNPVEEWLNIDIRNIEDEADIGLQLFSSNGTIIWGKTYKPQTKYLEDKINVENLSTGIYLLLIKHKDTFHKIKFLVL
jgi:hypothetical protein